MLCLVPGCPATTMDTHSCGQRFTSTEKIQRLSYRFGRATGLHICNFVHLAQIAVTV